MRPQAWISCVILPLDDSSDEEHLLLPATVLASWFNAPLQLVTADSESLAHYEAVAAGLGVPIEPVVTLGAQEFVANVAEHAERCQPAVCVASPTGDGLELAARSGQPTFLMARGGGRRMATGPLVVPVTGAETDLDALAVAATWAQALELQVRLVVDAEDPPTDDVLLAFTRRLSEVGVGSEIDRVTSDELDPTILVARSRSSTAIVVAADRLGEGHLADDARDAGMSLLVAPVAGPGAERTPADTLETTPAAAAADVAVAEAPEGLQVLDPDECARLLAGQMIGRLGYIDDGWPVVVPVNFAVSDDEVVIRSVSGAKLLAARRGDIVCLEVDDFDVDARSGWSVLAHGPLEIITDPPTLREAWDHDPAPWVPADEWQWLRLRPVSLTGRRLVDPAHR